MRRPEGDSARTLPGDRRGIREFAPPIDFGDTPAVRTLVVAFALAVLSLSLSTPSWAQADERTLAVVPLDGLGVDPGLLDKLNAALRAQVDKLELPAVSHDEVKAAHDQAPCDADVTCLARLGQSVGARRVLAGSVGVAADEVHIALKVIDVASGTESKPLEDTAPADQAEKRLQATALKLLDPERYNASGSLVVKLALSGAEVVVDGMPRGTTPLFGPVDQLPPGRRDVEVRYAGLKSWRGFVDVPFDEPVRLELAEKAGALVEVPRGDAPTTAAPAPTALPALTLAGGGLLAVGAVAFVGAAVAYVLGEQAYVKAHDDRQLDFADDAQAAWTAQAILFPVAVVGIAAGAGLLGLGLTDSAGE